MRSAKPFVPRLKIEDLMNGGSQKAVDSINAGADPRESKKLVRHLSGLDLKRAAFEYLKQALMPLMAGHFIGSTATNVAEPIYRAVPWSVKPTNKAQLGYPPHEIVLQGRANNPGKPIFYGSAGCHSTIMELEPNPGDRLVISKWRTKANLHLVCAGYSNEKSGMTRYKELPWVKTYAADPLSQRKSNGVVHEFITHEFTKRVSTKERWKYKISAAISELMLNALSFGIGGAPTIELAGILYPSTPNECNADNVALRCHFADNYLEFVSVQYIEITQKTHGPTYSMRGLDFADSMSETGEINWQNLFPPRLIAGTDHTVRYSKDKIEIMDNKNLVVASVPCSQAGPSAEFGGHLT